MPYVCTPEEIAKVNAVGRLLESRANRCYGEYAVTTSGEHVMGNDPAACCWCLAGAVQRIENTDRDSCTVRWFRVVARIVQDAVGNRASPISIWDGATPEQQDEIVRRCIAFTG
jgi:hypothetical protein